METLFHSIDNQIAFIYFNRPNALNALNALVFEELNQLLDDLELHKELRAIIITGNGKAFVAGADISEMRDKSPEQALQFSKIGHATMNRIENFSIPVIAAINGFALGGGLEMALACDFIIASDKAKFSAPEVNLGLIPGFNGSQRLYRVVGPSYAKYMLFTAEMVDAQEALRVGLVQKVVDHNELIPMVTQIAESIASKGHDAIRTVKKTINIGLQKGYVAGSENEPTAFASVFNKQGKEGMTAFLEKRKPKWE